MIGILSQTCLSGNASVVISTTVTCIDGFFCPNNDAAHPPEYCPPTFECQLRRLQEAHNICDLSQGKYEPTICKAGFYCPVGGKSELPCPRGYFCPLGSVNPIRCTPLSVCSEGSSHQIPLLPFLCIALLDIILVFIWILKLRGPKCDTFPKLGFVDGKTRANSYELGSRHRAGEVNVAIIPNNDSQVEVLPMHRTNEFNVAIIPNNDSRVEILPYFEKKLLSVGIEIIFRNISMYLGKSKDMILHHQNGRIRAGSFLAIMGPSGSGKTTLVNILTGRVKASTGSIYINGVLAQTDDLKTLVGYVPQEDIVLPELTVRENIMHSARIRLGRRLNSQEIQNFVDTLINSLGLYKVRDCYVGVANRGISGGERKRVNIALELAAAPQVLLLDEPTSGLDARTALSLIELLKSLSEQGVTICCVVHQPRTEIFLALDYLLLLNGGRQVYFGQAGDVIPYLERLGHVSPDTFNPADRILDVITGLESSSCQEDDVLMVEDQGSQELTMLLHYSRSQRAPWYVQVYLKFLRGTKQQGRQVSSFSLEIASGAITGLLIGLSNYEFKGHLFQGLFKQPFEVLSSAVSYRLLTEQGMLSCLAIGCAAGPAGVKTFGDEKLIFYRETYSGHSKSAYILGKILSTIFRIFLSSLHFTAFYMILTTPIVSFKVQLILNFLYFYCIYGLGCLVAATTTPQDGPLMTMLISVLFSAFVGCAPRLVSVKSWNLEWLWYIFPGVWYSEATFNEYTRPLAHVYNIQAAADVTGYKTGRTGFDLWVLFLIGSIYRLLSALLLRFLSCGRRT